MNEILCEYGSRCHGCPARGLAPRTRAVLEGVAQNALVGFRGESLGASAREWLQSIDPPKNAPQNPDVVSSVARAAIHIAEGNCEQHILI